MCYNIALIWKQDTAIKKRKPVKSKYIDPCKELSKMQITPLELLTRCWQFHTVTLCKVDLYFYNLGKITVLQSTNYNLNNKFLVSPTSSLSLAEEKIKKTPTANLFSSHLKVSELFNSKIWQSKCKFLN